MSNTAITSKDLQVKYEQLYKFLMNYLWEFRTIQAIANLEIAIFKSFPDKDEMTRCLRALKQDIFYTYNELSQNDETAFKETVEDLEQAIEDYNDTGVELYGVEEVIDDPDDVAASDDLNTPEEGKKKFKFGEIRHTTAEERALQEEAANTLSNPFEEGEE
jgi:hypothetical protein